MKNFSNTLIKSIKIYIVPIIFVFVNIVLSVILHWPYIRETIWEWRPAHTLLITFWFKQEGISLLNYQAPLFGHPWQVPLEFPLYQAICTIISDIFSISILTASHLTSLLIFFISAIFLLLICYDFFDNIFDACVIFTVYLWLPYNFVYSNEILIDYFALTLALGFIYFAMRWFYKPNNLLLGISAIIFVSLGSLVKVTTMPVIFLPFIFLLIRSLKTQGLKPDSLKHPKQLLFFINTHKTFIIMLILMVLIPLLTVIFWTKYTDEIKLANPFTAWLSSGNLKGWNYGTLSEKLSLENWWRWISNIFNYFLSGILLIFPVLSLILVSRAPAKSRELIISSILGIFITIFIFFHLYLHEYYYIAISAYISILIGYGLSWIIQYLNNQRNLWLSFIFLILFGVFVISPGLTRYKEFRHEVDLYHKYLETHYYKYAQKVREYTPSDEYIVLIQEDWESYLVLAAERKAFVLNPRNRDLFTCETISGYPYSTVIGPPESMDTIRVLNCFTSYEQVASNIFKVYK